ncbi:MAG: D-alanine--D-alanine ligase family protein [Devosia sp.]
MHIGLTYDLRDDYLARGFSDEEAGEFDVPETIDAIEAAIRCHGHQVERIGGIKALVAALATGKRWDLVFNICEGVSGIAREAQVPALLEAYGIACTFSPADVLMTAMDKALAKLVVRSAGVLTPDYAVVRNARELQGLNLPFPLFVKPLAEGTSKGVQETSRVGDRQALTAKCLDVLKTHRQPALIETFLPGREFTVGLLGGGGSARVIGVSEISFKHGGDPSTYSYRNKMEAYDELTHATDPVAVEAGRLALAAWRALGCRDAGRIDIRCDAEGRPNFIEANPLAGLRPGWSELAILAEQAGMPYRALIGAILDEAAARVRGA